jgi:hypothetical protein
MTQYRYVQNLPDLIDPAEYADHPEGRLVRIRITATANGVEIVGDAMRPEAIESLLSRVHAGEIEQMLCG